jgi:hypothetical protein
MTTPVNQNTDPAAGKPPKRRRWVPVSLRMFATTLVMLGVGSVLWIGVPAYRQHLALEELTRVNANVHAQPRGPAWFRRQMGDERMKAFDEVIAVQLNGSLDSDDTLGYVGWLPDLQMLNLCNSDVTDDGTAKIRNLRGLQLWLCNTSVTDAGLARVGRLTRLRFLLLDGTQVTDAGLTHLAGLHNLELLGLADTNVTAEGIAKLQLALPRLKIYRDLIAHPRSGDRYLSTSNVAVVGAEGIPLYSLVALLHSTNGVICQSGSASTNANGDWKIRLGCPAPFPAGNYRLEYFGALGNRSSRPLLIVADPRHGTIPQDKMANNSIASEGAPAPVVRLPETELADDDGTVKVVASRGRLANGAATSPSAVNVEAGKPFEIAGRIRNAVHPLAGNTRLVVQVIEVVKESTGTQYDLIVSEDFVQPSTFAVGFEFRKTMIAPLPAGRYLVRAIYRGMRLCETEIEVMPSDTGESSNHPAPIPDSPSESN